MIGRMRVDVRKEFTKCVCKVGGVALDDILQGPSDPTNADYWFPDAEVVVELKCLVEDLTSKPDFQLAVTALHVSWVRDGLMPPPRYVGERVRFNLRDMPQQCAFDYLDLMKRRLQQSAVKKADKQIASIKNHFKAPNAKGLLLFANDGNLSMKPELVAHLMGRMLHWDELNGKPVYSRINSIVYFSANERIVVPGISQPVGFWFNGFAQGRDRVDGAFLVRLREGWVAHEAMLRGEPIESIELPGNANSMEEVWFERRPQKT